ncbi:MAG: hypothetical protein KDA58_07995, partial [Planctomycetaceae bacterium]|nr:hypothetical protein [Planctomycetaceae bacterium]
MSAFKWFFGGLMAGAGLTVFALQYHVVHTNEGVIVVARTQKAPLRSTYVDVRDWSLSMWQQYPEVSLALASSGRTNVMTEGVINDVAQELGLPSSLTDAPTAQQPQSLVPIRFVDPPGMQPQQNPVPSSQPPVAIPWDEFLRGGASGEGTQSSLPSTPSGHAAVTPAPSTTVPSDRGIDGTPQESYIPLTATRTNEPDEVLPNLFRQVVNVQKPAISMTDTLGEVIEQQSREIDQFLSEEVVDPTAVLPPTPLDTATEAPRREWVRGLLK